MLSLVQLALGRIDKFGDKYKELPEYKLLKLLEAEFKNLKNF